jgi:BlaI family penicillinase repressor
MQDIQITDAEQELMKILWEHPGGMTSGELREKLDKSWERTTVLTLLSRLADKGAVAVDKETRPSVYKSLLSKEEYSLRRTRSLLDNLYNGSVKTMMAALCSSGDLTEEDFRELQALLNREAK